MHNRNKELSDKSLAKQNMINTITNCLTAAQRHKRSYKSALLKLAGNYGCDGYDQLQEFLQSKYKLTLSDFKINENHSGYSLADADTQQCYFSTAGDGKNFNYRGMSFPSSMTTVPYERFEQLVTENSFPSSSSNTPTSTESVEKDNITKLTKKEVIDKIRDSLLALKLSNKSSEKKMLKIAGDFGFDTVDEFVQHLKSEYQLILEKFTRGDSSNLSASSYMLSDEKTKEKILSTRDQTLFINNNTKNLNNFKFIGQAEFPVQKRQQETSPDERPSKRIKTARENSHKPNTQLTPVSSSLPFSHIGMMQATARQALNQQIKFSREKLIKDFISFAEQCKLLNLDYHDKLKKFVTDKYQLDAPSYIKLLSDHNLSLKITDSATGKDVALKSLHDNSIIKMYSLTKVVNEQRVHWQLHDFHLEPQNNENMTHHPDPIDSDNTFILSDESIFTEEYASFTFFDSNRNSNPEPITSDATSLEKGGDQEDWFSTNDFLL